MNWRLLLLLVALPPVCAAQADIGSIRSVPAGQACRQAIEAAERAYHIPSHLLAAIARVESGRRDPASGLFNPWPWTINMDGAGSFYDNKAQAVAVATSMRPRITRSIDVGCMQISLTHHPDAFTNLDAAFDPASNVAYGASLLTQLFEKSGSWLRAVELYHSATPDIGQEYRVRVYAAWPEEQKLAASTAPAMAPPWTSTVNRSLLSAPGRQTPPVGLHSDGPPSGRSLEAYRAMPVRLVYRPL